jgi:hypothetical protein
MHSNALDQGFEVGRAELANLTVGEESKGLRDFVKGLARPALNITNRVK